MIYGESYLRWTYENPLGRLALNALVKRSLFSNWYGWRMDGPKSRKLVAPFIGKYGIDMDECQDAADSFGSFNEFFYRRLKPTARPVESDKSALSFPADGRHLAISNLSQVDRFYVKGQQFDLKTFLGSESLASEFEEGSLLISRLCPVDYHRFHSPVSGSIVEQRDIGGDLFSVSPIALRRRLNYLWENKRALSLIDSSDVGKVAFVAIGATCVGRIHMIRAMGDELAKGDELGYFAFGGSCVATLFKKGAMAFSSDLVEYSNQSIEVYSKMGDALGRKASP